MDQQVCLRWNNFHSSLTSTLEYLWDEESLVDVTLLCEGHEIKAHKIILSACSPTFKNLLKDTAYQHPIVILHNIFLSDLEAILQFIYKGEVNIDQDQLSSLLQAATTLQIRGLAGIADREKNIQGQPDIAERNASPVPKKPRLQHGAGRKMSRNSSKEDSTLNSDRLKSEKTKQHRKSSGSSNSGSNQKNEENDNQQLLEPKLEPMDNEDLDDEEAAIVEFEENLEELAENLIPEEDVDVPAINPIVAINKISNNVQSTFSQGACSNTQCPPYPCPLCFRSYTSWGFRRRHIKSMHTFGTSIPCKWCTAVMPSNDEWEKHVMAEHALTKAEAEQSLLVVEEAHMVLQNTNPPQLDTLVDMVHQGHVNLKE